MFPDLQDPSFWTKITVALLCGGIVGLERQLSGKPVGIRTNILICLGTMLFIHISTLIVDGREVARVLGQVITGIGFLGAGTIMTKSGAVSGMTSAAEIWLMAGIGVAIGFGYYGVALVITFIALIVLIGIGRMEYGIPFLRRGEHATDER